MAEKCVVVGGGHAAAQVVSSLRQEGWQGEILMVGDEPSLPYQRPPLSKAFLSGEKTAEELFIRPAAFYEKNNIAFLNARVEGINRQGQKLNLADGSELAYDKLVLCTGASARKIPLPGAELAGVHYLRTISDVENIKQDIGDGKNAVIVGGGYIGLETAASLRKLGMNVVVLEMASRVLQRVTAPELSEFYTRVHTEEGVNIHTDVQVESLAGEGRVSQVVCANGETFDADLVVIGVGIIPNVELAQAAGLKIEQGIVVDEHCQTDEKNIWAAGDCTVHFNALYDRWLRLESVPNANEQAKVIAATICGKDKNYQSLPWFWSDQYDLKLQIAGLNQGYDQVLVRGDRNEGRSFAAFYFKGGTLICADCVNRPKEFMLSKKIIANGSPVEAIRLVDESIPVNEILLA